MQPDSLTRCDPRAKFFALLVLAFFIVMSQTFATIAIAAALACAVLWLSPMTLPHTVKQLSRVAWFLVVIVGIQTFATSGRVWFEIGGLFATREGVRNGIFLAAKLLLLTFFSLAFLATTRLDEMLDAAETASAFIKRSNVLFLLVSITLNFIPLLIRTAQQIKTAQIARGADVDSSVLKQLRFASGAALPLFVSAFRSSRHLADAIDARGFDPSAARTPFRTLRFQQNDWVMLVALAVIVMAGLYAETRVMQSAGEIQR
jgi:energy-coupling factor transport system permease protein